MAKYYYIIVEQDGIPGYWIFSGFRQHKPVLQYHMCLTKACTIYKSITSAEKALEKIKGYYKNTEGITVSIQTLENQ